MNEKQAKRCRAVLRQASIDWTERAYDRNRNGSFELLPKVGRRKYKALKREVQRMLNERGANG